LRAPIDILALQHLAIRADLRAVTLRAAQRIARHFATAILTGLARLFLTAFARLALLARLIAAHGLTQCAHAVAQRLDCIGLTVDGGAVIALAQRLFGLIHGAPGIAQAFLGLLARLATIARQQAFLTVQLAAQIALTLRKAFTLRAPLTALEPGLVALALPIALRLILAARAGALL